MKKPINIKSIDYIVFKSEPLKPFLDKNFTFGWFLEKKLTFKVTKYTERYFLKFFLSEQIRY